MDGTGKLFTPLCSFLPASTTVVPLPQSGSQTYEFLAAHVATQLPEEDFIIVAESFSGPIAALLTEKHIDNLRGIVFIATFLSCPKPALVSLAKYLPLKLLLSIPFSEALISRYLLAGFNFSTFSSTLKEVPSSILRNRLRSIQSLKMKKISSDMPSIYISAKDDILVSTRQIGLFRKRFPNLIVEHIQGTHFLSQSNPEACSEIIRKFSSFPRSEWECIKA